MKRSHTSPAPSGERSRYDRASVPLASHDEECFVAPPAVKPFVKCSAWATLGS